MYTDPDLRRVPDEVLGQLVLSPGMTSSLARFRPVLALTVTRPAGSVTEVLCCVRDAESNATHPDVLSSPTRRLHGLDAEIENLVTPGSSALWSPDWLNREMRALLVDKLDMAPARARQLRGGRLQAWQAESVIGTRPDGTTVSEALTMINVHLALPSDAQLPSRTSSYTDVVFVPSSSLRRAYRTRDASVLPYVGGRSHLPVVYGLCTLSTAAMVDSVTAVDLAA